MTGESTFCLKVTKKDDHFHAVCRGEITLTGVMSGWAKLAERCFKENIVKIICQPHASAPAEFLDVYQFGVSFRDISWPPGMRVAVVCGKDDLMKYQFAETMASNFHGPESRIFTTLEDARAWLFERP